MGDFGPAYFSADRRVLLRCVGCGFQAMQDSQRAECRMCGEQMVAAGEGPTPANGTTGLTDAMHGLLVPVLAPLIDQIEAMAEVDGAGSGADEAALDELPLEKVEPHVLLTLSAQPAAAEPDGSESRSIVASAPTLGEYRATGSAFGTSLAEIGDDGITGEVAIADPRTADAELANAEELKGRIALMWRGGCSFVDKVRQPLLLLWPVGISPARPLRGVPGYTDGGGRALP